MIFPNIKSETHQLIVPFWQIFVSSFTTFYVKLHKLKAYIQTFFDKYKCHQIRINLHAYHVIYQLNKLIIFLKV